MKLFRGRYLGRVARMPFRLWFALSYYRAKIWDIFVWVFRSRELANFTYELTDENLDYLAHTVSVVARCNWADARRYIDEARSDEALHEHVIRETSRSTQRYQADDCCFFGRRLGWYAFVRLLKPRVVVETGVDKGHGAVLLCAALLRNAAEGSPGAYYGTDLNPDAGWLLKDPYSKVGKILYGDSIMSLEAFPGQVDLFINDSDHSADYEFREYQTIHTKLAPGALVLGDNSHVTRMLSKYSREAGRSFLFFKEVPKDHWYPGAGIGISFGSQDG